MADDNLQELNQALHKKLVEKLREGGKQLQRCELCLATTWQIGNYVTLSIQDPRVKGLQIGGKAMPLAAMVCTSCGNTKLLNLLVLGIVLEELDPRAIADEVERDLKP